MKKIRVSTPGKLMLFGEHAVVYDKPCIVAAVDQRLTVQVEEIGEKELIVEAPDVNLKIYRTKLDSLGRDELPKEIRFVEAAVKKFYRKHKNGGLRIKTKNGFSADFGFGSSAAVTVGLSKALHELFEVKISEKQLFDWCYEIVLEVQGVGSGFDVAAALFGGFLYFVTGGKKIRKLKLERLPIVVGYTGVKADTPTIVRQVAELKRQHPIKVGKWFKEITGIVERARTALADQDWKRAGGLMNQNQAVLKELGVSSIELDRLIEASLEAGADGAKLSGAGGGDCMIALVDEDKRSAVEKAVERAGGKVLKVSLGAEGARDES